MTFAGPRYFLAARVRCRVGQKFKATKKPASEDGEPSRAQRLSCVCVRVKVWGEEEEEEENIFLVT